MDKEQEPVKTEAEIKKEIEQVATSVGLDASIGGKIICPRCGFDTRQGVIEIPEEDKQEYVRSLMSGRPFSKEYKMFEGKAGITFHDLTMRDSDRLIELLSKAPRPDGMIEFKASKAKMVFGIEQLKFGDKLIIIPIEEIRAIATLEDLLKKYDEVVGWVPETIWSIAISAYNAFNKLLTNIGNGGLDKDF